MLWFDLVFWFPFSSVILTAMPGAPAQTQRYIMLLNWLNVVRHDAGCGGEGDYWHRGKGS